MPDIPSTCGGVPKPTHNETPYGEWRCEKGVWKWYAELGLVAKDNMWNKMLYFFMIK